MGMTGALTIVMYHYVRDMAATPYPQLKALDTQQFEAQLDALTSSHTFCTIAEVIAASRGEKRLPADACLLTFDDGFIDHYQTVFPRLEERGIEGSFFPIVEATEQHRVPDVHKIHFVLASVGDVKELVREIVMLLKPFRKNGEIPNDQTLYKQYAKPGRLDPPEVMFVKRALQSGLPEKIRSAILDELFHRHVTPDEVGFAKGLYMDMPQLRCMARHGMVIGGHGKSHQPLSELSSTNQQKEINETVAFLARIYGSPPRDWVMCYPWGVHNATTVSLAAKADCALGFGYGGGIVKDLARPLVLTRVDTVNLHSLADSLPGDRERQ